MARRTAGAVNPARGRSGRLLLLTAVGFAAAAAIRIAFLVRLRGNFDFDSYEIAAGIVRAGGNVYEETTRYNYSPLWAWTLAALSRAAAFLGISLARAVTLLLFAADAATSFVIFRILRRREVEASRAGLLALLFFSNPVSILTSSVRGMFDDVAILFLLVGVLALARGPGRAGMASAALSLSLLVKHVAWFHPLLLLRREPGREGRGRIAAAILPYAVFLASFLPFARSWPRVRAQVFGYQGMDEPYGLELLRMRGWLPPWGPSAVCAIAGVSAALWLSLSPRRVEIVRASRVLFLVVLLFLPGVSPYYFVWPVALGALQPNAGYAVYTAVVTLFLIHSPDGLAVEWPHLPGWGGVWWAVLFWLLWELRTLSLRRRDGDA